MAAAKTKAKRVNKRKARTEVSSPSSSDSESLPSKQSSPEVGKPTNAAAALIQDDGDENTPAEPVFTTKKIVNPKQAFEDFYLRQATKEFANDLDKLREASDFNAKSVSLLVGALKQGTACFSREERVRVGGASARE